MTARIPLVINSGAIQELQSGDNFNLGTGATLVSPIITGTGTAIFSQVNIVGQGDLRLEDASGGQYVALQAPATIPASYTLTWPDTDGTAGQALITDGSGVLSWSSAASGDVYGPASATDNAVARFDLTTGKIIQNSAMTIGDDGASVLSVNSANDGLRITQIGAGNALVVEDSANPDATPFVVTSSGQVGIGVTATNAQLEVASDTTNETFIARYNASDAAGATQRFKKSRGTGAIPTIVSSGDSVFNLVAQAYDGSNYIAAARVYAEVDGTPGTNDMPGRLVFSTTADGASSPTERMRIRSDGNIGFGGSGDPVVGFRFQKDITGGTNAYAIQIVPSVLSGVTGSAYGVRTLISTSASAFTLSSLNHFFASQNTIGAGSAVTNQYGFTAESSLTGATNNYGFYSNIASGTGRWNFYAAGTAQNYFAGNVGIGVSPTDIASAQLVVGIIGNPEIALARNDTVVSANNVLGSLSFYGNDTTSNVYTKLGAVTCYAESDHGAGDNPTYITFSTTADGASSPTERMRIRSDGAIGVGTAGASSVNLYLARSLTGATAHGTLLETTVLSDVTASARGFVTSIQTTASSFTLPDIQHYRASQGTIGAGSTVTGQYGFFAHGSLTGATNNYGFYSNIASGTGRYNFYASGTADNYFAGRVSVGATQSAAALYSYAADGTYQFGIAGTTKGVRILTLSTEAKIQGVDNTLAASYQPLTFGGSQLVFETNGTTERMRIDSSGNVLVTGAGGLGYGTGSGGAVTQGTSRTTGVTLNKTNGAITLVSAAGSASYQSFTVTNSTVAATDTIIINQKSGTDLYEIHVTAVAAGSFRVSYRTTGGTTTEQPVFNFAVIKAVTA